MSAMHATELGADKKLAVDLRAKFDVLRDAAALERYPSAAVRVDRLRRAIDVLIRNESRIVAAMNEDFAGRPEALTLLTDVMAPIRSLRFAMRHVKRWMRPENRRPEFPMGLIGGRAQLFHQPLGVIGIVAPWNAPVALAFSPLASALAAGNRGMIKPSELVPRMSELIAEMVRTAFAESEVAVVTGGVAAARAFTSLPFNHIIFTGGAATARHVLRVAAANLIPVTLELGGKSPAIVAQGSDVTYAARKIAAGKFANAGQVCMAPDFVLVHRDDLVAFTAAVRAVIQRMFPVFQDNPDYTRVHLARQRQRLAEMVAEVARRGVQVEMMTGISIAELELADRFPPIIVVEPPLDCALMREEIFGPVLPILAYDSLEGAVRLLQSLSDPLALYFLGGSAAQKDYLLKNTHAGGVTFDDVMLHPFMQDLPFGGVGESGMGRYLGYEGFKALSNGKGVVQKPWLDISRYIAPPFTPALSRTMRRLIRFQPF